MYYSFFILGLEIKETIYPKNTAAEAATPPVRAPTIPDSYKEVLNNLNSIHGALLCMNRSIHTEGTFGIIKCDKSYKRLRRKGLENVQLEFLLVACGYNLYKYHNKITRLQKCV